MKKRFLCLGVIMLTLFCACGGNKEENNKEEITNTPTITQEASQITPRPDVTKPTNTPEPTEVPTQKPTEAPIEIPTQAPTLIPTETPTPTPVLSSEMIYTMSYLESLEEDMNNFFVDCYSYDYLGFVKFQNVDIFTYIPKQDSWEFPSIQYKLGDMFINSTLMLHPDNCFNNTLYEDAPEYIHTLKGDIANVYVNGQKLEDFSEMFIGQDDATKIDMSTKDMNVGQKILFNIKVPYDTKTVVFEYLCTISTYDEFKNEKIYEDVLISVEVFDSDTCNKHYSGSEDKKIDEIYWEDKYHTEMFKTDAFSSPENKATISFNTEEGENVIAYSLNSVEKISFKEFLNESKRSLKDIEEEFREGGNLYASLSSYWQTYKDMLGNTIYDLDYSYFEDMPENLENVSFYKFNVKVKFDEYNFKKENSFDEDIYVADGLVTTSWGIETEYPALSYIYHHSTAYNFSKSYFIRNVALFVDNFKIGSNEEKGWEKECDFNIYIAVDDTTELTNESVLFRTNFHFEDENGTSQKYTTLRGFVIKNVLDNRLNEQ